ncbi:DgyrCDS10211 [Dimorphilus gyrociliatus]|uniref:DgyrCDS10211 n=1 Tax=Dimorphilus gyrociliatus TaxID=2664684 RepID=A0A7I8W0X9_9ANNE|nr:DgyrCDS10211 [Dimorphilus gyrociliatus]
MEIVKPELSCDDDRNYEDKNEKKMKCRTLVSSSRYHLALCKICNGSASGIHYGVLSCEACKIFFKRSDTKYQNYQCRTGKRACSPFRNFTFICRYCRYEKCLREGMSRARIRIGRYPMKTNGEEKTISLQNDVEVPRMITFYAADDLLQRISVFHHKVTNINWSSEIKDFSNVMESIHKAVRNTFVPLEDFLDIYNITGVEIDNRSIYKRLQWKFIDVIVRYNLTFLKSLPGFIELDRKDFIHILSKNIDNFKLLVGIFSNYEWSNPGLNLKFNETSVNLDRDTLKLLFGDEFVQLKDDLRIRGKSINVNYFEILFIAVLPCFSPNEKFPHFKEVHKNYVQVFIRCLKTIYGDNYDKRLRELVNLQARYADYNNILRRARSKNKKYFQQLVYVMNTRKRKVNGKRSRRVHQKKTVLPPCQVCCKQATGFHYGLNTCEACKIFFRRSTTQYLTYSCIDGQKLCQPNKEFAFNCKLCRYQKCIDEGMSRTRIKIGRYSREMHSKNKMELEKLSQLSPQQLIYLPKFSDADDSLTKFGNFIESISQVKWSKEIENLDEMIQQINEIIETGFFPKDEYELIYNALGIEIDNRRVMCDLAGKISSIKLRQWIPFLKSLPGISDIDDRTFVKLICSDITLIHTIFSVHQVFQWEDIGFCINLNDKKIVLQNKLMDSTIGERMREISYNIQVYRNNMDVSKIELAMISILKMFEPRKDIPQLSSAYNRLLSTFIRHLEGNYGNSYHLQLGKLVNFFAELSEISLRNRKHMEQNKDFLKGIGRTRFNNLFLFGFSNNNDKECDECFEILKEKNFLQ